MKQHQVYHHFVMLSKLLRSFNLNTNLKKTSLWKELIAALKEHEEVHILHYTKAYIWFTYKENEYYLRLDETHPTKRSLQAMVELNPRVTTVLVLQNGWLEVANLTGKSCDIIITLRNPLTHAHA